MDSPTLICGDVNLCLLSPKIMGIVNVTPDSFSDGGQLHTASGQIDMVKLLNRVEQILDEGAAIIDVGGESTRPGAKPVTLEEELNRVVPVVAAIRKRFNVVVSVDTSSPELMRQAADNGAGLINDVRALQRTGAMDAAAKTGLPVCLMHMQGQPQTMQAQPQYVDIVGEVYQYLSDRVAACQSVGIATDKILIDPGFGFGKSPVHNLALINNLHRFASLECSILVGVSRKSTIGEITGKPAEQRLFGSLAMAYESLRQGAKILRVHDVGPSADIIKIYDALEDNRNGEDWYDS